MHCGRTAGRRVRELAAVVLPGGGGGGGRGGAGGLRAVQPRLLQLDAPRALRGGRVRDAAPAPPRRRARALPGDLPREHAILPFFICLLN